MEYANENAYGLSAEFLRIHSPAADGKMRSIGGEKVIIIPKLNNLCACPMSKIVKSPSRIVKL